MRHTIFLLLISAALCSAQYQPDEVKNRRLNNPSLGTGYLSTTKTAGVTGVTANLLVKIDATGNVVNAALSDVGILGIATNTVGAGLPVEVATRGIINCVADGATVIGNLLGTGTATAGRCKDLGQTDATLVSLSLQVVGKALSVSGGAGNLVLVQLYGPGHYGAQSGAPAAPTYANVPDGSPIAWDLASATVANGYTTLDHTTATRALNISNPVNGGFYTLVINQDGTGGALMTLGTGCTWKVINGGAGLIVLTAAASAIDILTFTYDGANCYAGVQTNFN